MLHKAYLTVKGPARKRFAAGLAVLDHVHIFCRARLDCRCTGLLTSMKSPFKISACRLRKGDRDYRRPPRPPDEAVESPLSQFLPALGGRGPASTVLSGGTEWQGQERRMAYNNVPDDSWSGLWWGAKGLFTKGSLCIETWMTLGIESMWESMGVDLLLK